VRRDPVEDRPRSIDTSEQVEACVHDCCLLRCWEWSSRAGPSLSYMVSSRLWRATRCEGRRRGWGRIWLVGTTGRGNAADARFWSLEHPSAPGFADRYGISPRNVLEIDFIE
jgi:hypothetical protein